MLISYKHFVFRYCILTHLSPQEHPSVPPSRAQHGSTCGDGWTADVIPHLGPLPDDRMSSRHATPTGATFKTHRKPHVIIARTTNSASPDVQSCHKSVKQDVIGTSFHGNTCPSVTWQPWCQTGTSSSCELLNSEHWGLPHCSQHHSPPTTHESQWIQYSRFEEMKLVLVL